MPMPLTTVVLEPKQLAALRKRAARRVAAGEAGASVSAILREILREALEPRPKPPKDEGGER